MKSISARVWGEAINCQAAEEKSILRNLIDTGANPPYSCSAGSCGSCRALLVCGKVRSEDDFALSTNEIEQGYILTCQSFAESDIEIDFDA